MPASARCPGPPVVLVRSAWQTVNIGDIAHTPGLLRLLEKHHPQAQVILWPGPLDRGVEPMLRRRFPRLRIVRDGPWWTLESPHANDPTLEQAFEMAHVLIHGSGSSLGGSGDVKRWLDATGKPFGAFGVTLGSQIGDTQGIADFPEPLQNLLSKAAFIYTRETRSIEEMRLAGIQCPHLDFAPDAAFGLDLRNEPAARNLLDQFGLQEGGFLCAIPRLRFTPYWQIHANWSMPAEIIAHRKAVNDQYAEPDHAKLREAITTWVRQTGLAVLICPEMTYQVDIIKPLVWEPLPNDVRDRVFPMERYWLPDEAASVYRQARAVISMECHSPIMAISSGRPAMYLRQPTDTWKGQMYVDLGLRDSLVQLDEATGGQIADRLLTLHREYPQALERTRQAVEYAADRHALAMRKIAEVIGVE